jgi:hypothetical protein
MSPQAESGNIYLPYPAIASWIDTFIEEASAFPNGRNDDQVDAMTQALNRLRSVCGSLAVPESQITVNPFPISEEWPEPSAWQSPRPPWLRCGAPETRGERSISTPNTFSRMPSHRKMPGPSAPWAIGSRGDQLFLPHSSTLVTSNLPFAEWTEVLGSERLTGALLDRLTHDVHILEMNGESYRLKNSKKKKDTGQP